MMSIVLHMEYHTNIYVCVHFDLSQSIWHRMAPCTSFVLWLWIHVHTDRKVKHVHKDKHKVILHVHTYTCIYLWFTNRHRLSKCSYLDPPIKLLYFFRTYEQLIMWQDANFSIATRQLSLKVKIWTHDISEMKEKTYKPYVPYSAVTFVPQTSVIMYSIYVLVINHTIVKER